METEFHRQRGELRREQRIYRQDHAPPASPADARDLESRLSRQRDRQRQLQQQLRQTPPRAAGNKSPGRGPGSAQGRQSRSMQDRQRLYLKLQRRSWRRP
ncbi:MAG: hypothetical protein U9R74_05870 [Pseudomonadota bacterium]|nr:hypothetical protein [Pseudomonadota bacterium]